VEWKRIYIKEKKSAYGKQNLSATLNGCQITVHDRRDVNDGER